MMPDKTGHSDTYLTDVSEKDKPWDTHRSNALRVQTLYQEAKIKRYADRIQRCSLTLGFVLEAQDSGQLKPRLREAQFCRVRHCPVCQWRRSLIWRARFFQAVPKIMEDYPTAKWVFLTLTVRNCELTELRTKLSEMNKAFIRLTKVKNFPALGFVKSVEVTRSQDGTAHPHFHVLMMVPASYFSTGYIPQAEWREMWQKAMRIDYLPVVNVKAVKAKKRASGSDVVDQATTKEDLAIGILETMKYGVKEADLMFDADWLAELTKQLHKTRAISVGGVLRKYVKEDDPENLISEDAEETPTDDDIDWWFGWREAKKRYVKIDD